VVFEGIFTLHGTWKNAMRTIQVLPFWPLSGTLSTEMKRGYLLNSRSDRRWRLLAVLMVVIGQLGIVGAALTLARDESSAISHTEESGTSLHHGHNEATCASCALLSLQSALKHAPPPIDILAARHVVVARLAVDFFSQPQLLPNSCRAPPSREV
jgi:hypothetical protein